ncbi:calcium-binding protein [Roseomonas sp. 18066]|uniref:calcium-binding protein n=1 Tax=Roseomonas sp. 18066 TaxID=2681412 RepID=UPI0013583ED7|nr:calcium-binding protein [Roseomonas sp. 18066]
MSRKTYDYSTSPDGLSFVDQFDGRYQIWNGPTLLETANFGSRFTLIGTGFADYMEAFSAKVELHGGDGDDTLLMLSPGGTALGGAGDDLLIGGLLDPEADPEAWVTLNGGAGNDHMIGLDGNTRFAVDSLWDIVEEDPDNTGIDVVIASTSYQLMPGQGIEVLQLASSTGKAALWLTGNEFDNTLVGNGGNNKLVGGGGDDVLIGKGGNDLYGVDSPGDRVIEAVGGGYDTVIAGTSYALEAGQEIEVLKLASRTAKATLSLTGNEFDNTLIGNNGSNKLIGGAGDDVLIGKGGNDTYGVDSAGDRVIEAVGGGHDTIIASVSYALEAGQEIEVLKLASATGKASLSLTGNEFDNEIWGNNGANRLDGGAGNDTLHGKGGRDILSGGDGDDTLDGGRDGDWLTGGAGTDTFLFKAGEANGDVVTDFNAAEGDRVLLVGYGALEEGALLNQIDHQIWRVVSVDRSISEDIFFLDTMPAFGDFVFA